MGSYSQFGAVNTKIKVLQRSFLKDQDYTRLLEAPSLRDAVSYLRQFTPYGESIAADEVLSIRELEGRFRVKLLQKYEKLVHYLMDPYRELFRIIFMRYEVENLKLIFRAILRQEATEALAEGFYRSELFPQIDYQRVLTAKTLEAAVQMLQGTVYHRVLVPYVGERPEKVLFYLEMNLDRVYFNKLAQAVERLPREERALVAELLGKNTDMLNLQWIYRGLKYYRISPEELFNYSLTSGYGLRLEELRQLCYAADAQDLTARLRKTGYAFLFEEGVDIDRFMELGMERYLYAMLREMGRRGAMTILPAILYIHRLEYEMRDLFSLLEAKKFGMSAEDTRKFLVRMV